jgi:glycosyltransferase involved in cell wall biosynthesis
MPVMRTREHVLMEHPDQPALEMTHLLPTHRSLRLAVVTETYPPEVNGVAVTVARLIEGLLLRGHEIDLVRPRQALRGPQGTAVEGLQELLMRGMPIPRYPQLRMGLPAKAALVSQWQRRRPDLVHVATEGPLGWSAVQAARKLRLPVSADFRTNFHAYSRHYGLGWLNKTILTYLRKFHNRADLTLVPTETLRKELAAMGFERLSVVGRGVDTQRFDPALRSPLVRARWGVAVDDPVVLYVGRLAHEKNLELLIRAYQAMKQRRKSLRLVVIGEGPMADDLATQCPDALLLGVQGGLELAQSYASADIFLFPSRTETYGNVTAEALASGLAVVAFDYAAARELIINGHNGWTSGLQDDECFVRRSCEVLEAWHPGHPMRMNARRTMLSRDWSGIVEQMEERWRTLTAATQQLRTHDAKLGVMKTS